MYDNAYLIIEPLEGIRHGWKVQDFDIFVLGEYLHVL